MLEPEDYQRLFDYLRSRGRKVVLVGSCYWDEDQFGDGGGRKRGRADKQVKTAPGTGEVEISSRRRHHRRERA